MCSHTQLHRLLQQLSLLINLQALSQWSPSFEWHFRVQAEITSAQLNWRGPVFHIRGALQQSSVCVSVCVCVWLCVPACMCVREISFLYRFGGLMRAWDSSPQRRVNLRHLLCTSSIFLDSWHFTSWTNCQLSKLNFRNDMSKFTPIPSPEPLLHSSSLFLSPFLSLSLHISPHIYLHAITEKSPKQIHAQTREHVQTHMHENKWSSFFSPSTSSHLSPLLK